VLPDRYRSIAFEEAQTPPTDELTATAAAAYTNLLIMRAGAARRSIARSPQIDRLALERARQIAALPEVHRQLARPSPIGSFFAAQGFRGFRRATEHLDMKKGYDDAVGAFALTWQANSQSREMALDPGMTEVGIAVARSDDGWLVLVAVFIERPSIPTDLVRLERIAHAGVNEARREAGQPPLRLSQELSRVARAHSEAMAEGGFFDHTDRSGREPADRVRIAGIAYRAVAENIQFNNDVDPAPVAVREWLESPGHRENIMTARFELTGMGVAVDDSGGVYFTQLFLEPPDR